ncbi:MAG: hypothetical protein WCY93_07390 [Anaerolineaceae bacterium]
MTFQVEVKNVATKNPVYLRASVDPRYWEDGEVNGVPDDENYPKMPFVSDQRTEWNITIDLETGVIIGWPRGTTAKVHYEVCDAGRYDLLDADVNLIHSHYGYVPRIMCPSENGYGDYVIMNIDENGQILNWICNNRLLQDIVNLGED